MSKRFTDTAIFNKPWFRKLPVRVKCLWFWMLANCDNAGVLEFDVERASFDIGMEVSPVDIERLGDRITLIGDDKIWINSFVDFQYGTLSNTCNPHKPVIKLIEKHQLNNFYCEKNKGTRKGTSKGSYTLEDKDKEKEKEKEKEVPFVKQVVEHFNSTTGRNIRTSSQVTTRFINARHNEGYSLDDFKTVINFKYDQWKDDPHMCNYIRPKTLFGTNFEDYLEAAKNQPKTPEQKFKDLMEEHTYEEKLEMLKKQQEANEQI